MNALLSPVLDRPVPGPAPVHAPVPTSVPAHQRRPEQRPLQARPPLSVVQQHSGAELDPAPDVDQDPSLLCAKLALCVIEILAGARPLDQLGRWVSDAVFVQLLRRTVIASRSREVTGDDARRPRVRVGEPLIHRLGDSIVEAVVMIHQPTRSRAVALRLERHRTRWRATAISVL